MGGGGWCVGGGGGGGGGVGGGVLNFEHHCIHISTERLSSIHANKRFGTLRKYVIQHFILIILERIIR